jgi:hypothetical protein
MKHAHPTSLLRHRHFRSCLAFLHHHPPSSCRLSCERIWRKFHLEWATPRTRSTKTEENSDLHTIAIIIYIISLASSLAPSPHPVPGFQHPIKKVIERGRKIVSQFLSQKPLFHNTTTISIAIRVCHTTTTSSSTTVQLPFYLFIKLLLQLYLHTLLHNDER